MNMNLLRALTLTLVASPLAAAQFGAEQQIAPSAATPARLSIASGTRGTLVVWNDDVLRAAVVTDLQPAILSDTGLGAVSAASVATLDDGALVAGVSGGRLISRRLGPDGRPAAEPLVIADVEPATAIAVASNGRGYLLIWSDPSGLIFGAVLRADGTLVSGPQTVVKPSSRTVRRIAIASDGNNFMVLWDAVAGPGDEQTLAVLVAPDGQPRWLLPMLVTSSGRSPDVTWSGSEYLLVWETLEGGVRGRRLAGDGVLRGDIIRLSTGADRNPRVVWDGSGYALSYLRSSADSKLESQLMATRLTRDAVPAENLMAGTIAASEQAITASRGVVSLVYVAAGSVRIRHATAGVAQPLPRRRAAH